MEAVNAAGPSPVSNEVTAIPYGAPAAPHLTAATPSGPIVLSWTAPTGPVTSYSVYRGTSAGGESATALASGLTANTYTDTSAVKGTAYYYKITAVNGAGTSPNSNEATAKAYGPPAAPTLSVKTVSGQISLSWTVPTGLVTGYNLYRGTAAGGETLLVGALTTTTYKDTSAVVGKTYYYKVAAVNKAGTGAFSNEVHVAPQPPGAPTLSAKTTTGQVILSWTVPTGTVVSYSVLRGTAAGGEGNTPLASGLSATTYKDTSAVKGTTYYYKVVAANAAGPGPASNEVKAAPYGPPAAPTLSVSTAHGPIVLTWTVPTGPVTSYNVLRGTATGGETLLVSGLTTTTYTDKSAAVGKTYFYKVVAVNGAGSGTASNEATATPQVPGAPTLKAKPNSGQVLLSWTTPTGPVTSYSVYRGTTPGGESATALVAGLSTTSYKDTSVVVGKAYYYTVKAADTVGLGPASNEATATP